MLKAVTGKQLIRIAQAGLQLSSLAVMAVLFAAPAIGQSSAKPAPTTTQLSVATDESGSRTRATFTIRVNATEQGVAPAGIVSLTADGTPLASVQLDQNGVATYTADDLPQGVHQVVATYAGDAASAPSVSKPSATSSSTSTLPDFLFSIAPTTLTVKAGTSGIATITITPQNGFNQGISLSCSGLPVSTNCIFTPVTLYPTGTSALTSNLAITTLGVAGATGQLQAPAEKGTKGLPAYAIVVPGLLALVGLGAARKRAFRAIRIASLVVLMLVSGLGLSACSQRYSYFHNPPVANIGTPLGTYNVTVTASSANGSSITVHNVAMTLTVN